ncbi:A disintegrin-like and metallopeptidase (reprolysin type) with thrombospondin type 1 motif, 9 [Apodemus speciosus]|uniref:A disintegrin-like and metallopeptidase (Reprolysin type) with thrombospondin type 1 motif, 9 n=1 Tax=Apodemus speciosus TaxID=105296 RepID=A0ABQ0EWA8_APOSI
MRSPDSAAAVRKDRLHPRQVKLLESLSEYEIASPIRVNPLGEPFPTNVHFKRRRRSINSASDPWPAFASSSSSSSTSSQEHYRLSAFGQQFLFNLTAHTGFIAPLFTVTLLGEPGVNQTKLYSEEEMELRHCFYKGHVNTKSEHSAVISLCSGMMGTFRSHDGDYFIEPLLSVDEQEGEEEQNKPHIIYRRSTPQRDPSTGKHACDTSELKNSHSKDKQKARTRKRRKRNSLADDVALLKSGLATKVLSGHSNRTNGTRDRRNHKRTKRFLSYPRFVEVMVVADHRMVLYHGSNLQHYILTLMSISLAELGTICDPYRSCSISEDSGLSTAFTIAHELGHVFNMPHDDSNKCKEEGVKSPQHVMAPTLNFYTNPWMWSKCSRKYITEFLDTGYGECLLNEPESRTYPLPSQLPGLLYNVNKQCELIFGPGSQVCPYMQMQCRRLWCNNVDGAHKGCRTQHTPWADGTECEPGKKWRALQLMDPGEVGVTLGPAQEHVEEASKQLSESATGQMPKNGGKYCVGRRMKFKSCNTEPCLKQRRDFREEQCAYFDGKHFNINGLLPSVRWVPKYSGILMKDRCKLFCRVAGNTAYYQLRDRVIDGTPCGQDTNDICVQGLCRQAGCDHILNSKARKDKCGICGGDNSSCKTVAGTFNTVHYGYNTVVRIPAGATSIDVRQHSFSGKSEDDNYLALSNSKGEFLLNGDFVVSMSKREVRVGSAVIEYSGSDNVVERLNCTDRIEEELLLQGERRRKLVCTRESDQLTVSDQRCDRLPQPGPVTEACGTDCDLRWHIASKSDCSAQCGLGYRTLDIHCAKYSRVDGKTEKVDDSFCSSQPRPSNQEKCSGECSTGGWRYSAWTECSKSCDGGTQRRRAICVNTRNDVLDDSKCTHQDKVVVQRCNEFSCPHWKTGDWSECLVTCGKGHKHRQVWCQFGEDRLSDRMCDPEAKPEPMQTCQQPECAAWQAGPWGQCSVTCGQGYQLRAVKCIMGTYMSVVDDNDCNAATRPTDTQCSATCGKGTRMRYVSCRDEDGSVADESACATLPKPVAKEECSVTPCGQWKTLDWSSATRQVVCVNYSDHVIDRSECDPDYIPETDQDCSMSPCPQWTGLAHPFQNEDFRPRSDSPSRTHVLGGNQWRTGPWGACSSTCAGGSQRRVVVCQDENGYTANDCVERIKPDEQRACESGPCPQWAYGSWGECTKLCGGGMRTRLVVCQRANGDRFPDLSCEVLDKPPDREQCNTHACPQDTAWSTGPWSSCSVSYQCGTCSVCTKTCGEGSRYRHVVCVAEDQSEVHSAHCDSDQRPPDRESCSLQPCEYVWITGEWSECSCSVSCGMGVMHRSVQCLTNEDQPSHLCPADTKPEERKTCRNVYNCELPQNCKEVKKLNSASMDGEYFLAVRGKPLKVFCAGMHSEYPKEYVTLAHGDSENFSEVYGHRLHNPTECPYNGSRREDCHCRKDYTAAGFSSFQKIRIDLTSMQIITTDLEFARTSEGHPVPFATAGDCYSAAKCPQILTDQGRFSINLYGTGLSLTESARWTSQGNYAVSDIKKSPRWDPGRREMRRLLWKVHSVLGHWPGGASFITKRALKRKTM